MPFRTTGAVSVNYLLLCEELTMFLTILEAAGDLFGTMNHHTKCRLTDGPKIEQTSKLLTKHVVSFHPLTTFQLLNYKTSSNIQCKSGTYCLNPIVDYVPGLLNMAFSSSLHSSTGVAEAQNLLIRRPTF